MPIYEYYCPENNKIYQFYAKTLAQGNRTPKCPDNPSFAMEKIVSAFAVSSPRKSGARDGAGDGTADAAKGGGDSRMEAALGAMEREFSNVDENDPKAMGRMMRRLSELSGEKIDGEMEEVVRKLEEGVDPEKLEERLGGSEEGDASDSFAPDGDAEAVGGSPENEKMEPRHRYKVRRGPPVRDPRLYDYE